MSRDVPKRRRKKNKRKTARIGSGCDGNRPRQIGGTRSADGVVGRRSSFVSHLVFLDFWVLVVARRRFSISSSLLLTWALLFFFCFVCFLFLPICLSVAAIKENEIEKCLKKKRSISFLGSCSGASLLLALIGSVISSMRRFDWVVLVDFFYAC